jgi:hypothetical protein
VPRHPGPALARGHEGVDLGGPHLDQRELGRHEETVQGDQQEGEEDPPSGSEEAQLATDGHGGQKEDGAHAHPLSSSRRMPVAGERVGEALVLGGS